MIWILLLLGLVLFGCGPAGGPEETGPSSTVAAPVSHYPPLPNGLPVAHNAGQKACNEWADAFCERQYDCGVKAQWDLCLFELYASCSQVSATIGPLSPCLQAERVRTCGDAVPRPECSGIFRSGS